MAYADAWDQNSIAGYGFGSQVIDGEDACCVLQVEGCELRVTRCRLHVEGRELLIMWFELRGSLLEVESSRTN